MMRLLTKAAKATIGFVVIFIARTLAKDSAKKPAEKRKARVPQTGVPSPTVTGTASPVSLSPLPATAKYENTVWIPRILWALEWTRQNGKAPATAADLAHVLQEECKLDVRPNNMARAFRQLAEKKIADGLWTAEDKQYRITDRGRDVLAAIK